VPRGYQLYVMLQSSQSDACRSYKELIHILRHLIEPTLSVVSVWWHTETNDDDDKNSQFSIVMCDSW